MLEAYLPFFRQGNIIKRKSWKDVGVRKVFDDVDKQEHIALVDLNNCCKVISYIQLGYEDLVADDWGLHLCEKEKCKCDCKHSD